MTNSYEVIKNESFLYRRFERVNIVVEYKDFRMAVPPPLNVVWFIYKAIRALFCGCRQPRPPKICRRTSTIAPSATKART